MNEVMYKNGRIAGYNTLANSEVPRLVFDNPRDFAIVAWSWYKYLVSKAKGKADFIKGFIDYVNENRRQ